VSVHPALRGRSFVASALTAAAEWLIEPAEPAETRRAPTPLEARPSLP